MDKRQSKEVTASGVRFVIQDGDKEVARGYLYIMKNDLHDRPFGLMEDVFVDENQRGRGYGKAIVKMIEDEARARNCYKLIATSRHARSKVHDLYKNLGFMDFGREFRKNL
jgi:GNAT superfamily N-acetyltransferase